MTSDGVMLIVVLAVFFAGLGVVGLYQFAWDKGFRACNELWVAERRRAGEAPNV
jgi:hypothetical protein